MKKAFSTPKTELPKEPNQMNEPIRDSKPFYDWLGETLDGKKLLDAFEDLVPTLSDIDPMEMDSDDIEMLVEDILETGARELFGIIFTDKGTTPEGR